MKFQETFVSMIQEEEKLLFSFWPTRVLVGDYTWVPSLMVFAVLPSGLSQDTGDWSQALQRGTQSFPRQTEVIWGAANPWWPPQLLQVFCSYCFLGMTARSRDLPDLCAACWPATSWGFSSGFLGTVSAEDERTPWGWHLHLSHPSWAP